MSSAPDSNTLTTEPSVFSTRLQHLDHWTQCPQHQTPTLLPLDPVSSAPDSNILTTGYSVFSTRLQHLDHWTQCPQHQTPTPRPLDPVSSAPDSNTLTTGPCVLNTRLQHLDHWTQCLQHQTPTPIPLDPVSSAPDSNTLTTGPSVLSTRLQHLDHWTKCSFKTDIKLKSFPFCPSSNQTSQKPRTPLLHSISSAARCLGFIQARTVDSQSKYLWDVHYFDEIEYSILMQL